MTIPIVAVANHKGGSGKTITVHLLAQHLAAAGRRVLAVDLDDQGTLSARFGLRSPGSTIADHLVGEDAFICEQPTVPGLDVIPADHRLAWAAAKMQASSPNHAFLKRALARVADGYDLVLLDCPPAANIVMINALCAASHLLVAATPTVESLDGAARMKIMLDDIRDQVGRAPALLGIVATQAVPRSLSHQEHLARFGAELLCTVPLRVGVDAPAQLYAAYAPLAAALREMIPC